MQIYPQPTCSIGLSGSAAEKSPDSLPKTSTSPDSIGDGNTASSNPKESTTFSSNLEPSSKPQEDWSSSPGLQGHPLPITSFTPTPTAEEVVTPYKFFESSRNPTSAEDKPAYETASSQDIPSAQDNISTQDNAPVHDIVPAQYNVSARDTPTQNTVSAQDTSSPKLDEQTQTKAYQPLSFEREGSAATKGETPQENASQGYGGSKTFVEREVARKSVHSY